MVQIQRVVRGRQARRRVRIMRQRIFAATEIQRVWRGYCDRLIADAAEEDQNRHKAAIQIQRIWRGRMAKMRVEYKRATEQVR